MTHKTIAERLGLSGETRELKLGRTFTSKDASNAFHTIRYDFKPVSVDATKSGTLEIGENNTVTIAAPNVEGSGAPETIFKGSRKPHQKECVLVINHETGEITLERLSQNIIVKTTRDGYTSKAQQSQRSNTPVENRKPVTSAPKHKPNSSSSISTKSSQILPKKHNDKTDKLSPPKTNGHQNGSQKIRASSGHCQQQPISPSMPMLSALANIPSNSASNNSVSNNSVSNNSASNNSVSASDMLGLSDSSSDSSDPESSSSSSNSSDEDDDNDNDSDASVKSIPNQNVGKSRPKSSSSSSSSDFEDVGTPASSNNQSLRHNGTIPNGTNGVNSYQSMPKFSQLSDDLRLSESGSDSD